MPLCNTGFVRGKSSNKFFITTFAPRQLFAGMVWRTGLFWLTCTPVLDKEEFSLLALKLQSWQ